MTASELNLVVRELSQPRKLEVIEERSFKAGNTCMDDFEEKGSPTALRLALYAYRVAVLSIRNSIRYNVKTS